MARKRVGNALHPTLCLSTLQLHRGSSFGIPCIVACALSLIEPLCVVGCTIPALESITSLYVHLRFAQFDIYA